MIKLIDHHFEKPLPRVIYRDVICEVLRLELPIETNKPAQLTIRNRIDGRFKVKLNDCEKLPADLRTKGEAP